MSGTIPGANEIISGNPEALLKKPTVFEKLLGRDKQEKHLLELTEQVAQKLLKDISEDGIVSLHTEKTGKKLIDVVCRVSLTSPKLPCLYVSLNGNFIQPNPRSLKFHEIFGVPNDKKYISATEEKPSKTHRSIAVVQKWDMPKGSYVISYRRDAMKEDAHQPIPRSTKEKIQFLEDILEATVDKAATAKYFGGMYIPGYTRSGTYTDGSTYQGFWVRDLKQEQFAGLLDAGQPKLTE